MGNLRLVDSSRVSTANLSRAMASKLLNKAMALLSSRVVSRFTILEWRGQADLVLTFPSSPPSNYRAISIGYGHAPPPAQHAGPAPTGGPDAKQILQVLISAVNDQVSPSPPTPRLEAHALPKQNIGAFYPAGSLEPLADAIARSGALPRIAAEWKMPMEIAMDLCKLALFDTILYCDDSGSMAFEEGGSRIDDLKLIISRVAAATSLFDQDGIQVRFMNSRVEGNGINSEAAAMQLINQVKFSGLTPLGTALDQKILQPLVLAPARAGRLSKPVLIIAVTDGVPVSLSFPRRAEGIANRVPVRQAGRRRPLRRCQGHHQRQPRAHSHALWIRRPLVPVRSGWKRSEGSRFPRGD